MRRFALVGVVVLAIVALGLSMTVGWPLHFSGAKNTSNTSPLLAQKKPSPSPSAAPVVEFDPNKDAILPTYRIVAFYAVPNAAPTGPTYKISSAMLTRLKSQGAAYQKLDPAHPVKLGIDLVVSVPDRFKGKDGDYSHHVPDSIITQYANFCKK